MSAFGFMWDAAQSGQIRDLEEKVEALEKDMATAREWINYLAKKVELLEKQNEL